MALTHCSTAHYLCQVASHSVRSFHFWLGFFEIIFHTVQVQINSNNLFILNKYLNIKVSLSYLQQIFRLFVKIYFVFPSSISFSFECYRFHKHKYVITCKFIFWVFPKNIQALCTLQIYTVFNCVHFPLQSRCAVYIFCHIQSNVGVTVKNCKSASQLFHCTWSSNQM